MGPVGIFVLLGVVGLIGYGLLNLGPTNLKLRFAQAGQLAGRTKADIVSTVGRPNSVSAGPDGGTMLQWINNSDAGAYHVVLLFDANDVCLGVTHEYDGV